MALLAEIPDYPSLYDAADAAARREQARHFRFVRAELIALVAAAATSAFTLAGLLGEGNSRRLVAAVVLVLLILTLLFRLARLIERFEERWFQSRALAESVKVESWLFMMKAEPYHDAGAVRSFARRMAILVESNHDVFGILAETPSFDKLQLTSAMMSVRAASVGERSTYYLAHRAHEQRNWYATRATIHQRNGRRWGWIGFSSEAIAMVFAVLALALGLVLDAMGAITTASTAALAWVQARDFRRLATTYSVVAHDLGRLEIEYGAPATSQELGAYVLEVERTLSREHTHWLSRRAGI